MCGWGGKWNEEKGRMEERLQAWRKEGWKEGGYVEMLKMKEK